MTATSARAERASLLLLFAAVVVAGAAFAWPWLPHAPEDAEALDRYSPLREGSTALFAVYDGEGALQGWRSENTAEIRSGRALGGIDLDEAHRHALVQLYARAKDTGGDPTRTLAGARVLAITSRRMSNTGELTTRLSVRVRDPRARVHEAPGDLLLALHDVSGHSGVVFEPALRLLPGVLEPGESWESRGTAGGADYVFRGRVLERTAFARDSLRLEDCLRIETQLVRSTEGRTVSEERWESTQCAGTGLVEEQKFAADGRLVERWVLISADDVPLDASAPPFPQLPERASVPAPDSAGWSLTRLARFGRHGAVYESTIPPTWIPTEPATLLVAGHAGDLIAYDADDPYGRVLWTFRPGGTIYGPPAWDAQRRRIYFGASDRRLYALDARGLFLWSFRTGDNVATRPVVVDSVVVFGSQDRWVYGVHAVTGRELWRTRTNGAVASSPAVVAGLVVIGSDDYHVRALDPATGTLRWTHETDGEVEAPIATDGEVAYAASRDGSLTALRHGGDRRARVVWRVTAGAPLRTAPLLLDEAVYVVTENGYVRAVRRDSGARLWVSQQDGYVGPAATVDGALLVARSDGSVHRLEPATGRMVRDFPRPRLPDAPTGTLYLGPGVGGGALWLADREPAVWRLGSGGSAVAPLPLAWKRFAVIEPFLGNLLWSTPVPYRDRVVVVDLMGTVFLVEPRTGRTERVAALGEGRWAVEPVVAGDVLLAVAGGTLRAIRLPDGRPLWSAVAEGTTLRPPVVAGDLVVRTTAGEGGGTLAALELATGRPRWSAPLPPLRMVTEPLVHGGVVYLGTPASAWDLRSGRKLWEASVAGVPIGSAALDPRGELLFVATVDLEATTGAVVALTARDGTLRWRADLGADEALNPLDRLWLDGEVLVVPLMSGGLLGLDARTGRERWRHAAGAPFFAATTVAGGRVLFARQDGQVVVLEAATGSTLARIGGLDEILGVHSTLQRPLWIGDRLLLAAGQVLLGFDLPRP